MYRAGLLHGIAVTARRGPATNDSLLRRVLVRYIERRAGFLKPQPGTEQERLSRAQDCIRRKFFPAATSSAKSRHARFFLNRQRRVREMVFGYAAGHTAVRSPQSSQGRKKEKAPEGAGAEK